MVTVPNRTRATLEPVIERFILPDSHIVSDGWAAYESLEALRGGVCTHAVVIHQRHFVDRDDLDVHTQNIENTWMRAKRKIKRQFGTSRDLFPTYLYYEFMWRNRFRNSRSCFGHFVTSVNNIYTF
ncbi:hypothetical protein PoB_000749000 [Plakobranchus ocellatus]|uniref:ISXO2-like transposase domain-containing protein n=1 Tax=Plakobranchus ocellatus TaxID=259542 RepID=A0AAV3YE24_9GAST|nr:hypothetical protein PoB_000749000 [Plakobranchus ocellatus]